MAQSYCRYTHFNVLFFLGVFKVDDATVENIEGSPDGIPKQHRSEKHIILLHLPFENRTLYLFLDTDKDKNRWLDAFHDYYQVSFL